MLVVRLELWPHGRENLAREIGRTYIANDGAGTVDRGDYKVAVCRRGTTEVPREIYGDHDLAMIGTDVKKLPKAARAGEVKDYPRLAYNVWRLIARSILAAFPEEDRCPKRRGATASFDQLVAKGFHVLAEPLRQALRTSQLVLPDGELGESMRAALEWLDAAARDDR